VSPRALTLYRILAYTTGVVLLVFTLEIVLKYGFGLEGFEFIAIVHGWIYMLYFFVSLYLAIQQRWSWRWTVPVVLAGTIPFASFVAERRVVAKVRGEHPELVTHS
jgi:integral membrane protein